MEEGPRGGTTIGGGNNGHYQQDGLGAIYKWIQGAMTSWGHNHWRRKQWTLSTRWPRGYLQMDPRGYDLVYLARLEERMKGRGFVSP
jgi:hypothetical protein